VGIDGFAGPSDLLILFGPDADPSLVALDLAAQAEHGTGSLVVGLSVSKDALDRLAGELELLAGRYPDLRPAACVLIEISDAREGLALANEFAPEHLELIGAVEEGLAPMVQSAGCLFVGSGAATAFGDYVVGSNHILPTAGCARFSSSLSARHFRRRMPEVRVPRPATKLARAGSPIAEIEGFRVHAESMRARIGENEEQ
jgi:histidinol dehydrogenase